MASRRVLMIAHHFPPAGGSGSNRALAFARHLPANGWQPVVVTPEAAWASHRDDSLGSQIPAGVRVIRTPSFEFRAADPRLSPATAAGSRSPSAHRWGPTRFGGPTARAEGEFEPRSPKRSGLDAAQVAASVLRSNVGHLKRFPDAHLGWLPYAVAVGRRVDYDVAYSSSGPFTSHLVGLVLKRLTRRPWVAELRDGWYRWNRAIFPDYPVWRNALERRLEAAALRSADRVVLVTDRMADAFRRQYADLPTDHFATVPNGFDRSQFPISPSPEPSTTSFEILHAGALYYGRSLAAFLAGARRLVDADPEFARQFRLSLVGTLDPSARAELVHHALAAWTTWSGQLDHASTIQAMRSANVLLVVANTTPGAEATVPGKVFEYLAVGRPVLALAASQSSTADVLNQTGGGWLAPPSDPAAIACVLSQAFRAHQAGTPGGADPARLDRFHRHLLAGDLAAIFDHVAQGARAARRL